MGGLNEDMMMAMVMNNGGMNPGLMNAENLGSGQSFTFTRMQNQFWEAAKKTQLIHHRNFMTKIIQELTDDLEARSTFYWTIFEKMHLELQNIKSQTFGIAEQNLELLKFLLDFDGAAEAFVTGQHFFGAGLNGS